MFCSTWSATAHWRPRSLVPTSPSTKDFLFLCNCFFSEFLFSFCFPPNFCAGFVHLLTSCNYFKNVQFCFQCGNLKASQGFPHDRLSLVPGLWSMAWWRRRPLRPRPVAVVPLLLHSHVRSGTLSRRNLSIEALVRLLSITGLPTLFICYWWYNIMPLFDTLGELQFFLSLCSYPFKLTSLVILGGNYLTCQGGRWVRYGEGVDLEVCA